MLAELTTCGLAGVDGYLVQVQVHVGSGLPNFKIVGLPDATVNESRERIRCAVRSSGFKFPPDRVTINLAPAHQRKQGPVFDLAMAVGILAAQEKVPPDVLQSVGVVGELSLDGRVSPIAGVLSLAAACRAAGLQGIMVPRENAAEAAMVDGLTVWPVNDLKHAVTSLAEETPAPLPAAPPLVQAVEWPDLADVRGHLMGRRALELAAAGGHNLLMIGPPGCGKTMLAQRLPGLLPELSLTEALEVTRIASAAGLLRNRSGLIQTRPFRTPHHTASIGGIVGGGSVPRPGEISLAHGGVLFMDELPEFPRQVLEVLREPLESCKVTIARAAASYTFPADILLVACMNPCPCGYDGDTASSCRCPRQTRLQYRRRLSGPLLDRIDLIMEVPPQLGHQYGESTATVKARVLAARERQTFRMRNHAVPTNARMTSAHIRRFAPLEGPVETALNALVAARRYSMRVQERLIRVARTIADLEGCPTIRLEHVLEAVQFRSGIDLLNAV